MNPESPLDLILSKLPDAKRSGVEWVVRCPAHNDRRPSLNITEGDDGRVLLHCHAGCPFKAVVEAMGLTMAELMPSTGRASQPGKANAPAGRPKRGQSPKSSPTLYPTAHDAVTELKRRHGPRSAMWTYTDTTGNPVGVVVRWDGPGGKDIRPVSRDAKRNGWVIGGMPAPRPLYRLPDLAKAPVVFVCEGEPAADAVYKLGWVATTSAHDERDPGPIHGYVP